MQPSTSTRSASDAAADGPGALAALAYGRQRIEADDVAAVVETLRGELLTQGPAVERFEGGLARATGAAHAVCVSSGTAALHVAYAALGVAPGLRAWVPANTFLATASAAAHLGAEVGVLDVERATGNLDLDRLEERLAAQGPPHVVAAVHFAGLPCDMQRLIELKRRHGFLLLEDAAHALGASYRVDGRWWAPGAHPEVDAACLSFHPVKSITSAEGGAVLVNDPSLAARLRRLRSHGVARDYAESVPFAPMIELGFNYRLSDLHAALGASQLAKLERFVARRRELAALYAERLEGYELLARGDAERRHAWHLLVVHTRPDERDALRAALREQGIHAQLHYAPLTWHPWFRARLAESVPCADDHGRRALSLPLHPSLSDEDALRVADALAAWRRR